MMDVTTETSIDARSGALDQTMYWLKRFGAAGFMFFLAKGIAWLAVPTVLYWLA